VQIRLTAVAVQTRWQLPSMETVRVPCPEQQLQIFKPSAFGKLAVRQVYMTSLRLRVKHL
jgi:hypothetical protein